MCGEHAFENDPDIVDYGSSPRMRGTLLLPASLRSPERFIPARAGNTRLDAYHARKQAVHPRACGEHAHDAWMAALSAGSSPRVRGTLA
ncbi:hypothetical protein GLX_07720 [Komagataeibacter medellinensis NBRC 3288]|uniref:Uncharacterized protein n=1 Tax=Komagataeibacter medellinensis (strain NBRC 3288 / BCRC 11682 / LMG 1693 / Kondo 51) TaxID=634177 RepID=G2I4Y7_KOMMN|nr:hypothetical protein GLX_07720 [Komagataeibacter medellinensis NBRC 3288]